MKRILLWSLPLFFFLIQCAGGGSCAGKKTTSEANLPDTFVWCNHTEAPTLDPGKASDNGSSNVIWQLFEGLTEYHPKTLEPEPAIATHWEVSADGKAYTFYLRGDAKWSNGDPVTAEDFEYSWKRALDPKLASEYASILYSIQGAEEYNTGKVKESSSVGVKALDKLKLQVQLKNPTPYFIQLTSFYTYRPVHKATVEQWGDQWIRPEHMVSNGAYKLVAWVPHKEILLEKNPHYWDEKNVRIPKAKFLPTEDRETSLKMFVNGEIDYIEDIPHLKIPEFRSHPGFQEGPESAVYLYILNVQQKGLDDPRVRRALNLALDKKQIVTVMQKGDLPATHLVPPEILDYRSPFGESFDPEKAKQLLVEAGYGDPKTFPKFSISYNTSEGHKVIAEMVQAMWKKHLGIEVGILNQEWKILLANYNSSNFSIGRYGWIGDYMDPVTFLEMFTSTSTINRTNWKNAEFDDLVLNQQATEQNPKKRNKILYQAEEIFLREIPAIPIYHYVRPILVDPQVKGFYQNLKEVHPLKFARFEG